MAKRQLPCPTALRLLLDYDPETGEFTWRERADLWFVEGAHTRQRQARVWNAKYAGKPALTADNNGRRVGRLFDNLLLAHRAAFAIAHGRWPNEVDHKNGNPSDNRLVNLREATRSQNIWNRASHANAASKYKGVSKSRSGTWRARIDTADRRSVYLGTFKTEKEAALAYNDAARRLHGNFARLNEVP